MGVMVMSLRKCQCCAEYDLTVRPRVTRIPSQPYGVVYEAHASLCDFCVAEHHALQHCSLCPSRNQDGTASSEGWVWTCAMLDHAQREHPGVLEKLANGWIKPPEPSPKFEYLGKLPLRMPRLPE